MNHAISNAGSLEAAYYRLQDLQRDQDLAQERRESKAEQILDSFDWKDVRDALDLAGEKSPASLEAFCEAMAIIPQLNINKIEDRRLRNIALAFSRIANFYAGHRAAQEAV